jgi:hypothetical protein
MRARPDNGAATVEHVGLVVLIALLVMAAVAAFINAPPSDEARRLGSQLDRRIRCPVRLPDPCWRDPLTEAYGRPLGGLVRALAPQPQPLAGGTGAAELPVDFRYCRTAGCATPGDRPGLTASNRRVTAFTSVADHRHAGGGVEVSYWLYRPGIGWDRVLRQATPDDVERYASTPLLDSANPVLVPLETLYGRDHYDFPPGEEPPWRWSVESVYPG